MATEFDLANFINIVVGGLLGGVASWLISHWYAKRTSDELMTVFRVFAEIAEEHKLAEFVRDNDGRITTGRVIRKVASDTYVVRLNM